ncbi:MAG: PepSY-associated TM helix domain-containing protein, partial [Asticcacaulis sp.]|nr:PepSY-associated TM helix domain-containing protein [Asticcacaulis sp.]
DEIYVDLATPGVDASITLGRDGSLVYERTTRGAIAVLNDLHKGRHAGPVWSFFIDMLALACFVFAATGLGLLWLYSRNRRITWPLVAAGLAVPLILYVVFVHA